MRRLWPDGLGARFALLLAAALVAANLVALVLLTFERDRLDRASRIAREVERIAALVPAIEAAAPGARRAVARDASTRFFRLSVEQRPLVAVAASDARSAELRASLTEALTGRDVRAAISAGPRGGETVAASIKLAVPEGAGTQWLDIVSRGDRMPPPERDNGLFVTVLGLSLAAVLSAALLALRRLTRPLAALARAARAAGRGDRGARVPEDGPREMREAAAAFNDMQDRIARFDAERMRTLAAVGHDLRTPITSLRIRAEMLDETDAAPMIHTLEEMTVMADGLVAFARGVAEAEPAQDVDLAQLLTRLCEERGAVLAVAVGATVRGRPVGLGRAIGNVVDNAVRYGGAVRVGLSRDAGEAVVTVEDDGPGIAPDRLAAVFEPFVRGEDSRSADTGGAGLGLSIARGIIAAHGGDVALENRAIGGLRATVRLPAILKV